MIGFPDHERARAWYASEAYRPLIDLRARNSTGTVLLVDGCPDGYRATDFLATLDGAERP